MTSAIVALLMIVYSITLLTTMVNREESTNTLSKEIIDLSIDPNIYYPYDQDFEIAFAFTSSRGVPFEIDETIFNFDISQEIFDRTSDDGDLVITSTSLGIELCEDGFGFDDQFTADGEVYR